MGSDYWSGSEGSGNESSGRTQSAAGMVSTSSQSSSRAGASQSLSRSAPENLALNTVLTGDMFDPMYSMIPSTTSMSTAQVTQTGPLISPLESVNPFDFPLDPALTLGGGSMGYLEGMDVDVTEGLTEEMFQVEDWSRYMWTPETGFEHLDKGYPAVTQ